MRDRAAGPVRALALIVGAAAAGCSLTDLEGLAMGTGAGGGGGTSSSASTASTGAPASTSGSSGGGTSSTSTASSITTGAGPTTGTGTGTGGEGGGDGGGGSEPCLDGQICKLVDDFEDGSTELWDTYGACVSTDTEGVLTVEADTTAQTGSYCGHYTNGIFDFRGGSVVVAVDEVTTDEFGVQTYLNVNSADETATVNIVKSNGALYFEDGFLVDYDKQQHRFWRISDRDGALVLSVHPADPAADWVELLVVEDHAVTLETVRIAVGVGTFADNADPGRATFDCVNMPLDACPVP